MCEKGRVQVIRGAMRDLYPPKKLGKSKFLLSVVYSIWIYECKCLRCHHCFDCCPSAIPSTARNDPPFVVRLAFPKHVLSSLAWRTHVRFSRTAGYTMQLGEHDDASDSEGERGDTRESPGPLPQDHADLRRMRVAERRRKAQV